ncbi:hypothetical protein C4K09_2367 [Pseudomonas chlororaphis subsp. aureofaciens]|nr:hypothetical protein C4K13_2509 [Pseudomonas chlororaphis subsp. aureofaciens]AZE16828.1 hypothetical protein C4K09_2367 [Pseudomonas chlororaphis subsp. aureofaciens]
MPHPARLLPCVRQGTGAKMKDFLESPRRFLGKMQACVMKSPIR